MKRGADHRSIFVSYEDKTGLTLARAVRDALIELDVSCWLWDNDHAAGYPFAAIARRIFAAEYICFVCTQGTIRSGGQEWEIENAFGQGKTKRAWVLATDRKYVPRVLAGYYQYPATVDTARAVVQEWVSLWRSDFRDHPSAQQNAKTGSDRDAIVPAAAIVDENHE